MKRVLAFIIALLIWTIACSWTNKIFQPTIIDTNTKINSPFELTKQQSSPTLTPKPSSTIKPTATDICPPQPSSANSVSSVRERIEFLVPGAKVVWYDDFICQEFSYGWWSPNTNPKTIISIDESKLTIRAENGNDIIASIIRNTNDITDNKGMLVLFRYRQGSSVTLFIDTGKWFETSYRGWGLSVNGDNLGNNSWFRWNGKYLTPSDFYSFPIRADTWYYLLIMLGEKGEITMKVMLKESQTESIIYHLDLGKDWAKKEWKAVFQVPRGILEVDEYWQLLFI